MLGETSFTLTQNGEVLQSVAYTYDDLNRLTTVSENGAQQAAYTYDTNGNRASLTYANGVTETYRYNKANWIISLENRNNSGLISSYTYTYYASGSQKTKTAADGKVTSCVYDGLNRLVQESETGALTQSYTYDARGNRATMTVTGTESYAVSYTYDANNRLLTEQKTQGLLTDLTTCTYDANGNLLSKTVLAGNGGAAGSTYAYNTLNQLVSATENQRTAAYAYNTQGIRTAKVTFSTRTNYLLDGANVVGERLNGEYVSYLRGANLISRTGEDGTDFYLFNAHGDVTGLADSTGASTRAYDYDAFGVEKDPDPLDENPFRYCGEYFDRETETYYLRARYYDPTIGRFTQQDTHWTTANSIYGDNPQKINEREDKLGLKSYSYAPQITAVMQSGNLYVYGIGNPVLYQDPNGSIAITTLILIGSIAAGLIAAGITAYRSYQYTGKVDWVNTIFTGLSWFSLAYTLGTSVYALYTDYCNYMGYTPTSEVPFNSSDSVLTVGGSSTVASSQISKMVSGVMPNRINHIMQAKHAWNLVGANDWTTVSNVIIAIFNNTAERFHF